MPVLLSAMCWNIAEGSFDNRMGPNEALPLLANFIRSKSPDLVLLNEAKHWSGQINQVRKLAELTGIPHCHWGNTTKTGTTGHKAVGILSRYPLGAAQVHEISRGPFGFGGYAILQSSISVENIPHQLFTTRFNDADEAEKLLGHQIGVNLVRAVAPHSAVVFGGDFNSGPRDSPETFNLFVQNSGLTNAESERPDPEACGSPIVDHIFYRGPYKVTQMERRCPESNPSDHAWVFIELCHPTHGFTGRYGTWIKLKHVLTGTSLHSHGFLYGHPNSSGQQQVTAFASRDDNDWWRVKGPHGTPPDFRHGQQVQHGDIIRLEHVSGLNLHSHPGHPSPVTGLHDPNQQEVTCFGQNGAGDDNDNWRVELEHGGAWDAGQSARLIHVNTNRALHSHFGLSHPEWTKGQQEVTCFAHRDDNDRWCLFHMR